MKGRMEQFFSWTTKRKAQNALKKVNLPGWQIKEKISNVTGRSRWAVFRPVGSKGLPKRDPITGRLIQR